MLNPSDTAAVVGGNVLTSQRVVDVILKAFGICAASQVRKYLSFYFKYYGSSSDRRGNLQFAQNMVVSTHEKTKTLSVCAMQEFTESC